MDIMDPTMIDNTLRGYVMALMETGYEKAHETATEGGTTITVYQNKEDGKAIVVMVYPDNQGWVGMYPQIGLWGGKYRIMNPTGAEWKEYDDPFAMFAGTMDILNRMSNEIQEEAEEEEGRAAEDILGTEPGEDASGQVGNLP